MMARPSEYSEALADRICDELMDGKSLVKICAAEDMPHRSTVIRWMAADEDFATKCARAREAQADYMDDMILDVAMASTSDTAAADRVKISAFQWRASKLQPKKYGDRLDLNHSGAISTMTEEQINERLAYLSGKARDADAARGTGPEGEAE